ncbi:MAG: hypothetical protein ETSY1_41165 [Candidatus Entotheonella factor]|uniref:Uncharacterized protein n=1 Tax=Entotheonella factor TaxID=1429438 RepID=W4L6M9_ENTF1|nr:MAG: hypothetical protein ETSY1_41165 [Candidatus Entotheonella factor]
MDSIESNLEEFRGMNERVIYEASPHSDLDPAMLET